MSFNDLRRMIGSPALATTVAVMLDTGELVKVVDEARSLVRVRLADE